MAGINNGELVDADELMNAYGSNFNDTAQMIFNTDYIGYDSRLANAGNPNLKNVFYSTFTSDDADINYGFFYDSTDDLYQTPDIDVTEYIIIEATSFGTWSNGTNDTFVLPIDSGKWLIYCDTGTDAVQRAQLHKSLWYGTNGTNHLILDFTSVTAVKTSHANDVGKQAHYAKHTTGSSTIADYTGTFANTSTNNNCSSWSNLIHSGDALSVRYSRWEIPEGVTRKGGVGGVDLGDELGTDTTGDENNNPADCQLDSRTGTGISQLLLEAIILCVGDISWVSGGSGGTDIDIDFKTDNSIPDMTAAGSLSTEGAYTSTLIFKNTAGASVTNAISAINSEIDGTSSEQISISANGGSNWTDVNNTEIARPTAGTALWGRIAITRTDLSKLDKVTEQAVKYNLY